MKICKLRTRKIVKDWPRTTTCKLIFVLVHLEIAPTSSALYFLMRMDVKASRLAATKRMQTRTQAVIAERPSTLGALPMTEVNRLI
jgi:hypothetical protein